MANEGVGLTAGDLELTQASSSRRDLLQECTQIAEEDMHYYKAGDSAQAFPDGVLVSSWSPVPSGMRSRTVENDENAKPVSSLSGHHEPSPQSDHESERRRSLHPVSAHGSTFVGT
jgi:hypothetical protein